MKRLLVIATLMMSAQSFAQDTCQKELLRTQSRLEETRARLTTCESNAQNINQVIAENRKLEQQNENLKQQLSNLAADRANFERQIQQLQMENSQLQKEIQVLRSRPTPQPQPNPYPYPQPQPQPVGKVLCSASCVSSTGTPDLRYIMTGEGYSQSEANLKATQAVQGKYRCNYGVKVIKCENVNTEYSGEFCSAACVSASGSIDNRYAAGANGRNRTEAEAKALTAAQSQYSCNYGVKVMSCN